MKATFIALMVVSLFTLNLAAQSLFQQDFEGPVSGVYYSDQWYTNSGGIVYNYDGVTPYSGYAMFEFATAPSNSRYLNSPEFTKPNVPYFISYWIYYKDINNEEGHVNVKLRSEDDFGSWHTALDFITIDENNDNVEVKDQWYFVEHMIPSGYNSQNYQIYFTGYDNVFLDDINISSTSFVSTPEIFLENKIKIYPNPTQSDLNITFAQNMQHVNIELQDITGKVVWQNVTQVHTNQTISINNKLTSGVYFLKIKSGNESMVEKIIFY